MTQQKSQLKIGILLNYVNMILGNLIPIFYTPVMLSLLGQSEYGLYKLSSSVTSYLSLISLGIGSAVTRYSIKAREEESAEAEERILGLFVVIFHIIALAAMVVGTVLTLNLHIWYGNSLTDAELGRVKILVQAMISTVLPRTCARHKLTASAMQSAISFLSIAISSFFQNTDPSSTDLLLQALRKQRNCRFIMKLFVF